MLLNLEMELPHLAKVAGEGGRPETVDQETLLAGPRSVALAE